MALFLFFVCILATFFFNINVGFENGKWVFHFQSIPSGRSPDYHLQDDYADLLHEHETLESDYNSLLLSKKEMKNDYDREVSLLEEQVDSLRSRILYLEKQIDFANGEYPQHPDWEDKKTND